MKYQPQLAKTPSKSVNQALCSGPDWIVERKWDGIRTIMELDLAETRIFTRTGQDLSSTFPEFVNFHESVPDSLLPMVLDCEIVALDPGRTDTESLELLQMRAGDKKARRMESIPVDLKVFDILEMSGSSLIHTKLSNRRNGILSSLLQILGMSLPETVDSPGSCPRHWEGTIAKRADSLYACGKRNNDWLKFKFTKRATLRVSGLTPGKGSRENSFGALMVEDANGIPRGQVGSGFPDIDIAKIMTLNDMGLLAGTLIEVEYRFLSKTGLMVNTAFKGLRLDKTEADSEIL